MKLNPHPTTEEEKALRLVCLAALAWQFEHDYPGSHASFMDQQIQQEDLLAALELFE